MKRLLFSLACLAFVPSVSQAQYPGYGGYRGFRHSPYYGPSAYINGGYFTPFGYQPYSMTVRPTFGGAIYQGNGGMIGPGFYSPYSYGGFAPSYGYGYGWGGGY